LWFLTRFLIFFVFQISYFVLESLFKKLESLFHRILTRAAHWTLLKNGANPETAVRLYWRKARFYLDDLHDFVIEMAGLKYARLKVIKLI
jgi:hypothetical protein